MVRWQSRYRDICFIGGQILDRGITIGNLIGFCYERKASKIAEHSTSI